MDEINSQVFNTIEDLRTVRILVDLPTSILSAEDYLSSASNIIDPFLAQWKSKNSIRLLAVDVYARHTYIAIDINNEQYDYHTAHKQISVLPVHILSLSRRSNKWKFFRRAIEDQVVACRIAELHQLNGQEPLPFLVDHIKGTLRADELLSHGRRKSVTVGVVILILGALVQATAYHRSHLIVGRVVSGVGLGIVNSTVPVMQVEFSPKATRGLYVCMQLSTLNFGILLAYWIDYGFSTHTGSYAWRVPVILQCAFLFPMLLLVSLVDETPRWLAAHDRQDQALQVLHRLYNESMHESDITALHGDILRTVALEKAVGAGSWKDLLRNDEIQSQRRFLVACAIQIIQQLGGINVIIYYSATLFEKSVGFSKHMSALMSGFLQTWFLVASFTPWFLIDRVGRRPLPLSMISLMAAVMAVQSALIYQVQNDTSIARTSGIAAAAMLFIFQGAFTIGFQATVWVYPSEILPLRLRQRGSSISTASNWICNYLVVQITPPAISNIGWKTYIIFAVLNTLWVPIIYFFFPETKGLQLEEVDRLFAGETEQFAGRLFTTKDGVRHVEEARM